MCIHAYAAGLLDGEGCIHVSKLGNHQLQVIFAMCDVEPLELLSAEWGGNVRPKRRRTSGGRRTYEWAITGSRALGFLRDVAPWTFGKAAQVKLALAYPTLRQGSGPVGQFAPLEEANETRQEIAEGLHELKQPKE